jgi:hypothetical protein
MTSFNSESFQILSLRNLNYKFTNTFNFWDKNASHLRLIKLLKLWITINCQESTKNWNWNLKGFVYLFTFVLWSQNVFQRGRQTKMAS